MTDDDAAARRAYRDKLRSVGFVGGRGRPREYRRGDGTRVKEITDEHGNLTRHSGTGDNERVDVQLRPRTITEA